MKIIAINTVDYGSTGNIAADLLKYAISRGNQGILCAINPTRQDLPTFNYSVSSFSKNIHRLTNKLLGNDGFSNKLNTIKLIKFIKREKPNIVHIHNIHGNCLDIRKLFHYLKNNKSLNVIWTFHDCWPITGKCPHFLINKCEKWKTQCFKCKSKHEYPISYFFDNSKKFYSFKKEIFSNFNNLTIVTVSHFLDSIVSKSIAKNCKKICINNGIEIDKTKIKPKPINNSKTIKVFSASFPWSARKGLNFINNISIFCNSLNKNISFTVAGLTKENKTSDYINRLPRLDKKEIEKQLNECDIYFAPFREESFSTSILEALSFGKPVIAIKKSGGTDEVVNKNNGYLINYNDTKKFLIAVNYCLKLNNKSIIHTIEKFQKEISLNKYYNLYDENKD